MPRKVQRGITDAQRAALRAWYQQQHPRPSQRACISWFIDQYDHQLGQSTISDSLSIRYSHLDAGL